MSKATYKSNGKPSSQGKGASKSAGKATNGKPATSRPTKGKFSKEGASKGNPSKGKPSWSKTEGEKTSKDQSERVSTEKSYGQKRKSSERPESSSTSKGGGKAGSVYKARGHKPFEGKNKGKPVGDESSDNKSFKGKKFDSKRSDFKRSDSKRSDFKRSDSNNSDFKRGKFDKKEGSEGEGTKSSEFKSKYKKDFKKPEYGKKSEYGKKTEYGNKSVYGNKSESGKKPDYAKKVNPYKAKEVKSDSNEKWDKTKSKKGPRKSKGYGATQVSDASFQDGESRRFIVRCSDMTQDGKGIVTIEGEKYHLGNVIEGEEVLVEMVTRGRRKYVNLLEVKEANAFRVTSPCEISSNCGGCQLQHISYEGQLHFKQSKVNALLSEFGKVSPIIGMKHPVHYRNKIHSTFSVGEKGKIISGIFEEESHNVISVENCLIQDERANAIIETIKTLMPSFKMMPYDEDSEKGFLRHVLIRTGHVSGEIMVVLVVTNPIFPAKNHFVKALTEAHPSIKTIVQNLNKKKTSMVLGDKEVVLYGKGYIEDTLCDTVFRISSKSFYQVNPVQTEILYNKAIQMAALKGTEVALDAYSGIGTISLIASHSVDHIVGIELNNDAVKDAISNAKRNGITNARFYNGDAGDFLKDIAKEGEHLDVVFMDPPRSGSDEAFLNAVLTIAPQKVVYISCNPLTLARDLKVLVAGGYKVEEIQPVDMFPGTWHVETIVCLQKKSM